MCSIMRLFLLSANSVERFRLKPDFPLGIEIASLPPIGRVTRSFTFSLDEIELRAESLTRSLALTAYRSF